jgi:hypothetical protein
MASTIVDLFLLRPINEHMRVEIPVLESSHLVTRER